MERIERRTVTDQVIDAVLDQLQKGELRPGDKIPPEIELAERLGVGRSSIREALKALQFIGLLDRHQDGTVVSSAASRQVLDRVLYSELLSSEMEIAHLFQARRIIEGEIAALAAIRISEGELVELQAKCEAMEALPAEEFEAYFDHDMAFHHAVATMAANPVLTRMWNVIQDFLESARGEIRGLASVRELSDRNHRLLVDALSSRVPDEARVATHRALQAVEDLFSKGLSASGQSAATSTWSRSPPRSTP